MKTYVDRVIESHRKGSIYTCWACFKQFTGRYVGTPYAYSENATFCDADCKKFYEGLR